MKRPKKETRRDRKKKYKTISTWLEAKRKKAANKLNNELNKGD